MNIKIVVGVLLVMLVTATGTVAAAQYSSTRQSGLSMVHTYNSDDSGAGRIVLYTVKPVTNPQIQRGDAFIPRTGIINPKLPVDANRNVYTTGWGHRINIYKPTNNKAREEPKTDNHVIRNDSQPKIFVDYKLNHAPSPPEYVLGEFIVRFKSGVSEDTINAINARYGVSVKRTSVFVPAIKVLSVPQGKTVEEMVQLYESLPEVKYACPNGIDHTFMVPIGQFHSY